MADILHFKENDILTLRKNHPCGGSRFRLARVGSDCRVICLTCGRDMTLPRLRLEKAVKHVEKPAEEGGTAHEK